MTWDAVGYIGRGWPIADIAVIPPQPGKNGPIWGPRLSPESRDIAGIGKGKGLPLINTDDTDRKAGDAEIGTAGNRRIGTSGNREVGIETTMIESSVM